MYPEPLVDGYPPCREVEEVDEVDEVDGDDVDDDDDDGDDDDDDGDDDDDDGEEDDDDGGGGDGVQALGGKGRNRTGPNVVRFCSVSNVRRTELRYARSVLLALFSAARL